MSTVQVHMVWKRLGVSSTGVSSTVAILCNLHIMATMAALAKNLFKAAAMYLSGWHGATLNSVSVDCWATLEASWRNDPFRCRSATKAAHSSVCQGAPLLETKKKDKECDLFFFRLCLHRIGRENTLWSGEAEATRSPHSHIAMLMMLMMQSTCVNIF